MPSDTMAEAARHSSEGFAHLEARDFSSARASLQRAVELAPDDADIHYRLGLLHSDLRDFPRALACFDQALRLDRGHYRALNNRGTALQMLGRWAEAEEAFRQVMGMAPETLQPYVNLGHLLEERGRPREAAEVYRAAVARNLEPSVFNHHLAALEGTTTRRAPDAWVVATFDNFAPIFEAHLRDLGYEVPHRLAEMIAAQGTRTLDILDLGCGTGMCGVELAAMRRQLVGVDLSPAMLEQARARGVYDELQCEEVHGWLAQSAANRFDLVVAADVLIYIGALEDLFACVHRALRPGGLFAFSTEECVDAPYKLQGTGRYAQSADYVRGVAEPAMRIIQALPTVIRMESGVPVSGRLWLTTKVDAT